MRVERLRKANTLLKEAWTEIIMTFFDEKAKEDILGNLALLQDKISHEIERNNQLPKLFDGKLYNLNVNGIKIRSNY